MSYLPPPFRWTHEQELDLVELGAEPARCLKGENGPEAQSVVAGRAHRALSLHNRFDARNRFLKDHGGAQPWRPPTENELLRGQLERSSRRIAALEKGAKRQSTVRIKRGKK